MARATTRDDLAQPASPMVVPAQPGEVLLSMLYDPTGLALVSLYDNAVLAWVVDATEPQVGQPSPRIIGRLPSPCPVDTSPVISPQWATMVAVNGFVYVPDLWRGPLPDFLTWLATNGGAERRIDGSGLSLMPLRNAFDSWATRNPDLAQS